MALKQFVFLSPLVPLIKYFLKINLNVHLPRFLTQDFVGLTHEVSVEEISSFSREEKENYEDSSCAS